MPSQRRIMLACPVYSGKPDFRTVLTIIRAICEASERGWVVDTIFRTMDSMIHRARNICFSVFADSTDYDDLFFIDADVGARPGSFARLMSHPVDLVGGSYRGRGDKEEYALRTLSCGTMQADVYTGLMEVEAVPTGFLRITRACAEKMRDAYRERWYTDSTAPSPTQRIYSVFEFEYRPEEHACWSEDYTFCRRYRDLGGSVWVDPLLELDHIGEKVYTGQLLEYLVRSCKPLPAQQAASVVDLAKMFLESRQASELVKLPEQQVANIADAGRKFLEAAE